MPDKTPQSMQPPSAQQIPHRFEHHGITMHDPWHWLKDPAYPTVEDPQVLAYLNAENAYYEAQMAPLATLRETLFEEMKARRPAAERSVPWRDEGRWYLWRYEAGADYRTWLWAPLAQDGAEPAPDAFQILLDERKLAKDTEYFQLGALEVSADHQLLAYSTDRSGAERYQLHVVRIESGAAVLEPIEQATGSPIFSSDARYLFYQVVNEEWRPHRVMRVDLDSGTHTLVYEEQDPAYFVSLSLTQSRDFLVISSGDHVTSEVRLLPRAQPEADLQLIAARRAGHEYEVEHKGATLLLRSNRDHRNFALYEAPLEAPAEANWKTLLAGSDERYLTGFACFETLTVLEERLAGLDQIRIWPDGQAPYALDFPEPTYAASLGTNAEFRIDRLRIDYESMVTPDTVYDYDLASGRLITRQVREIPTGYDPAAYVSERLTVTARDGVQVPVSLVYHRDTPPAADRPVYLYGYGAYGTAIPPGFSTTRLSLLDRGVTFAIAHIRGGDDLGYHWYEAGKLDARTNTFNDFVDVARDLIERGYS
ncbi:MAG: prolyl oligopeptidase family serine peptidase, partial [Pseudomonadota bacterium]